MDLIPVIDLRSSQDIVPISMVFYCAWAGRMLMPSKVAAQSALKIAFIVQLPLWKNSIRGSAERPNPPSSR